MLLLMLQEATIPLKHRYGGVPEAAPSAAFAVPSGVPAEDGAPIAGVRVLDLPTSPSQRAFPLLNPDHGQGLRGAILRRDKGGVPCDGPLSDEVQVID